MTPIIPIKPLQGLREQLIEYFSNPPDDPTPAQMAISFKVVDRVGELYPEEISKFFQMLCVRFINNEDLTSCGVTIPEWICEFTYPQ